MDTLENIEAESNGDESAQEKPKSFVVNQNHIMFWTIAITLALFFYTVRVGETDWKTFVSKSVNVAHLWTLIGLFSIFYQTRRVNTYEIISRSPTAIAILLAGVFIATAVCIKGI